MENYEYTQEDIQAHLKGLKNVSDVIYQIINGEFLVENIQTGYLTKTMKRQTDHVSLMLGKEHIQNSGADLTSFQKALDDGLAWISGNS